jgi:hypothetical protein
MTAAQGLTGQTDEGQLDGGRRGDLLIVRPLGRNLGDTLSGGLGRTPLLGAAADGHHPSEGCSQFHFLFHNCDYFRN